MPRISFLGLRGFGVFECGFWVCVVFAGILGGGVCDVGFLRVLLLAVGGVWLIFGFGLWLLGVDLVLDLGGLDWLVWILGGCLPCCGSCGVGII